MCTLIHHFTKFHINTSIHQQLDPPSCFFHTGLLIKICMHLSHIPQAVSVLPTTFSLHHHNNTWWWAKSISALLRYFIHLSVTASATNMQYFDSNTLNLKINYDSCDDYHLSDEIQSMQPYWSTMTNNSITQIKSYH